MTGKKILSEDGESIFAVAVSDKTIEIKRGKQKFTITGKDFSVTGTSRKGDKATIVMVKDGKIDESLVVFADDKDLDDEGELKAKEGEEESENEDENSEEE